MKLKLVMLISVLIFACGNEKSVTNEPSFDKIENDVRNLILPTLNDVSKFEVLGYYSRNKDEKLEKFGVRIYSTQNDSFDIFLFYEYSRNDKKWILKNWKK